MIAKKSEDVHIEQECGGSGLITVSQDVKNKWEKSLLLNIALQGNTTTTGHQRALLLSLYTGPN